MNAKKTIIGKGLTGATLERVLNQQAVDKDVILRVVAHNFNFSYESKECNYNTFKNAIKKKKLNYKDLFLLATIDQIGHVGLNKYKKLYKDVQCVSEEKATSRFFLGYQSGLDFEHYYKKSQFSNLDKDFYHLNDCDIDGFVNRYNYNLIVHHLKTRKNFKEVNLLFEPLLTIVKTDDGLKLAHMDNNEIGLITLCITNKAINEQQDNGLTVQQVNEQMGINQMTQAEEEAEQKKLEAEQKKEEVILHKKEQKTA